MLNHITVMGRFTHDPELRRTASGVAVASFSLAVDRDYSSQDSGKKETDFIDCVAWRQAGEFVSKYFAKGRMAVVSGRLQIRSWTDKDGNKHRSAEVVADNVYFGDSKKSSDSNNSTPLTQNTFNGYECGFPETMALIKKYNALDEQQSDFAMLEDDNAHLPF